MIKCSAPGKLMISGEWVVLENSKCIVAAIDKRVFVKIENSKEIIINAKDFEIKNVKCFLKKNLIINTSKEKKKKLIFMKTAIETTLKYIGKWKNFKISSFGKKEKIGFGSSSALTVAVVYGLLKFHNLKISKKEIFKISAISHYFAQKKFGSGFDIASSVFGNIIIYRKFDSKWLLEKLKNYEIKNVVKKKWRKLYIKKLKNPEIKILVGWTKCPVSTLYMIKKMNLFKRKNKKQYDKIYLEISKLTEKLIYVFKKNNKRKTINLIKKNELLLRELTKKSNVPIETEKLKNLSDIANENGGAGKLSGAGGGDIGIAICFSEKTKEKIKKKWQKQGIYPINVKIDKGVG